MVSADERAIDWCATSIIYDDCWCTVLQQLSKNVSWVIAGSTVKRRPTIFHSFSHVHSLLQQQVTSNSFLNATIMSAVRPYLSQMISTGIPAYNISITLLTSPHHAESRKCLTSDESISMKGNKIK